MLKFGSGVTEAMAADHRGGYWFELSEDRFSKICKPIVPGSAKPTHS
jgi:hypothetical protein